MGGLLVASHLASLQTRFKWPSSIGHFAIYQPWRLGSTGVTSLTICLRLVRVAGRPKMTSTSSMENLDRLCQLRWQTRRSRRFFHIRSAINWSLRIAKMRSLKSRPVLWSEWQKRFRSSKSVDLAKTGMEILAFSRKHRLNRSLMQCITWITLKTLFSFWFKSPSLWNSWDRDPPSKKIKMECRLNRRKKRSARRPIKFRSLRRLRQRVVTKANRMKVKIER